MRGRNGSCGPFLTGTRPGQRRVDKRAQWRGLQLRTWHRLDHRWRCGPLSDPHGAGAVPGQLPFAEQLPAVRRLPVRHPGYRRGGDGDGTDKDDDAYRPDDANLQRWRLGGGCDQLHANPHAVGVAGSRHGLSRLRLHLQLDIELRDVDYLVLLWRQSKLRLSGGLWQPGAVDAEHWHYQLPDRSHRPWRQQRSAVVHLLHRHAAWLPEHQLQRRRLRLRHLGAARRRVGLVRNLDAWVQRLNLGQLQPGLVDLRCVELRSGGASELLVSDAVRFGLLVQLRGDG